MKPNKDAFGQEIWSYYNGNRRIEIAERDDGYIDVSGAGPAAYFHKFRSWLKQERTAIKFARGKVLDVGAGAGRVSLYLQERGLDVTAIDNSPLAIKTCRKRGVKKARILSFEDVNRFHPGSFDTVIMYGNNFGLFRNPSKAKIMLKKLYRATSPGALIIAETLDPYKTSEPAHLSYHKLNRKRGRMAGQARIRIRYKNCTGDWFDYLLVSKKEMKEILKDTGWRVKKFVGSGAVYIAIIEKE
jgi:2-polyprenyl-3-methyl-5-hydroxy-6-metoxy-1,4-benzoquinol methylase